MYKMDLNEYTIMTSPNSTFGKFTKFLADKAKSIDVDAKDSLGRSAMAALFWNTSRRP